ncbi:MAG: glycine cleavage system protein H, partial [Verrucomicrobia bacterium]
GEGWIFALKMDNAGDLKNLQSAAAYKEQIG